jgi:hypothetical protein
MYSYLLQTPSKELVAKFNKNHGDDGRFSSSAGAHSASGHAGMTHTRQYGKDHDSNKGAVAESSNVNRGRRTKEIHADVSSHFGTDTNSKLRGTQVGGVFPHRDKDGNSKLQTVHSDQVRVDRQKSGVMQRQLHDTALAAAYMKAGLTGKNATIFHSDPQTKAADQVAKKIVMSGGAKGFASVAHAQKALEAGGLHGHAIIHKNAKGAIEIHLDIPKQHSAHGRGLRALAVNLRRQHGLTAEHFNGTRELLPAKKLDTKVREHLSSNSNNSAKYDELKTKHSTK